MAARRSYKNPVTIKEKHRYLLEFVQKIAAEVPGKDRNEDADTFNNLVGSARHFATVCK